MKQLHQRLVIFGLAVANIVVFLGAFLLLGGFQAGNGSDLVLPTLAQLSELTDVQSGHPSTTSQDSAPRTLTTHVTEAAIESTTSSGLDVTESSEIVQVSANTSPDAQNVVVSPMAAQALNSTVPPTMEPVTTPIPQEVIPDRVVINFNAGMTDEDKAAYLRSINATILQDFPELGAVVVSLPQANMAQFNALTPQIANSESDYVARAAISIPTSDTYFAEQWALDVIGATRAWEVMPTYARTVVVAVIDSGVCADHPDLVGRILPGIDLVDGDTDPNDEFDHGCGVIGVIAANIDNGIGIAGVAPNTLILPIRVLDENGVGSYSNVARAIVDAANHGVDIINLSLGGSNDSQLLRSAIDYAIAKGVMIIAAAGNTGTEQILYPAAYEPVIAVGSVDASLQQSAFSSRSSKIDLWAPGENIHVIHQSDSYDSESGTSFAAPQVSGVAALEIALGNSLSLDGRVVHVSGGNVVPTPVPTSDLTLTPVDGEVYTSIVIGSDDRSRITTTSSAPYNALVSLSRSTSHEVFCSGTLITRTHVLTAAHCVNGVPVQDILIAPGRNGTDKPFGDFQVAQTFVPLQWQLSQQEAFDYAVVELTTAVPESIQPLNLGLGNNPETRDRTFSIAGYPDDKPNGTLWEHSGSINSESENVWTYKIDTMPGQSGSSVRDDQNRIVGIHVRGIRDEERNEATRIHAHLLSDLDAWGALPAGLSCTMQPDNGAQLMFNDVYELPAGHDQGIAFLNGWFATYLNSDHEVNTLEVSLRDIRIQNGQILWNVSALLRDKNSDDPFLFCYFYTPVTWHSNLVDIEVEPGQQAIGSSENNGSQLVSVSNPGVRGGSNEAVMPLGFGFHLVDPVDDQEMFQMLYHLSTFQSVGVFKDQNNDPPFKFRSDFTVLRGSSINFLASNLAIQPAPSPFNIRPENPCGSGGCIHDFPTWMGIHTERYAISGLNYDQAYVVLRGWNLRYPRETSDPDHEIVSAGVWISSQYFDPNAGTLTYVLNSTLEDKDGDPSFVIEHAVSVLGITHEQDSDSDGVSDRVENGAPHSGDANQDGIADALQPNVTSLPNATDGRYVTFCVGSCNELSNRGTLSNVAALQRDVPIVGLDVPVGVFSFEVKGLDRGEAARVELLLPDGVNADAYYKIDHNTGTWELFSFGNGRSTGANVFNGRVEIRLRDGAWGDHDNDFNGTIVDPGVPVYFDNRLPVIDMLEDQTILEGESVSLTFTVTDPEGDPFTVTASIGTITQNADLTYTWTFTPSDGPADSQLVVIAASDGKPVAATRGFELTVENVAPTATFANQSGIVKATDPATLIFSEQFDPSSVDTAMGFRYSFDCESDGVWEIVQGSEPSFGCAYPKMGNYIVAGRIEDKDGGFTDYTVEVEVRLKLVAPETSYRLCSLDRQLETIQVLGLTDQQLKGQVIVSYITGLESRGQVDGGWYSVDHNGPADFTLTIEYPGLWDWQYFRHPLYGHPIGALHIDLQIEVLDADGNFIREEDGSVYTLAPGEDWGLWCMKTMLMDIQQPSLTVNEGLLAINLGRVSNRGVYTVSYGTVQENDDGSIIWQATPDDGPSQSQLVTIKACDLEFGGRGCTEVAFDLTVQNVAPTGQFVAVPDYIPPGAGTTLTLTDVVDPSRADTIAGFSYSFDCTNDGVYEITDSRDASVQCLYPTHGDYTAVARVQDKDGGYTDYMVPVIVNTDPVLTLAQSSVSTRENEPVSLAGLATDADGNLLTPTASIGMVTISPDGSLLWSYVPTDGPAENQTVTITVNDGHRGVVSQSFELVVENVAPTAEMGAQPSTVAVGLPVLITLTNSDDPSSTDAAAGFRFSFDCTNDGTFDLEDTTLDTFACIYTEVGNQTVLGRIKDKDGGFTDYTAIVTTTNQAPVISFQQQSVTGNEGQTVLNLGGATDPDGHTITLHASVGDVILHPDGSMVWSLLTTDGPVDSQEVSVTASDGFGGTSLVTFQLVVTNVPPIAVFNSSSATGIAGETINFSFTNQSDVSYQDASVGFTYEFDCDGDNVFEVNGGSLSIHGCSFGQVGTYTVMGRIYDKDAMFTEYLSLVTIMQPQANLLVTVVAPNQVQVGDTGSFILTVSNLGPNVATDVRLLNVIPAGLVLQSALPQQGSCDSMILCQLGTLAPGSSATVQVMVTFSTQGLVTFTVSASSDPMDTDLSNNQVTITTEVQSVPVNQPPVAGNDSVEAAGGTSTVVNVLSNDTDPDGDVLTVVSVNISSGGSVQINADQSILIAPDAEYVGTLEITYVISDGKGGQASGIVLVTVLN